ncbi:TrkH family potassium uptake protein [Hoeflea sp. TYP-13]|uniref:TrkH family potassium uptake protein n=1 Tax=Hoeflea sp. TYP-13 TaxID=3230023 RepID=UPI0034C5EB03
MNYPSIILPIGRLLIMVSCIMILPASADLAAGNPDWKAFLVSAIVFGLAGCLTEAAFRGTDTRLRPREAFILVTVTWLVFSIVGAVPLLASGLDISITDAFFEAASGLTTTGSTILTHLDGLPPGLLLWRSLLQWIGGVGIIVIGIWLLPVLRVGGQQLFSIESSENRAWTVGPLQPFIRRLLMLYGGLTLTCGMLYLLAGMSAFDAANHALTTVSTGGFSTSDQSLGRFDSLTIDWIAIVFMTVCSLPFLFLIRLTDRSGVRATQQVIWFVSILAASSLFVFLVIRWHQPGAPFELLTLSVFHVVSVVTTTGYAASDYLLWGPAAVAALFLLTFIGGCNGSTAGGFKIFRIVILVSVVRSALRIMVRPHRIAQPHFEGQIVNKSVSESILIFTILYAGTFALFALAYSVTGLDLETSLSASITALANVGPGIGPIIGPAGNFQPLPDFVKWLLAFEMILGRLEIIGGLLILSPGFWLE